MISIIANKEFSYCASDIPDVYILTKGTIITAATEKRDPQVIQGEINAYKILLDSTDYQAIKHSEGAISDDDYEPIRVQREEWREAINVLEKELEG